MDVIERFYDAFARRDAEGMAACYTPDVVFEDPAFGELRDGEPADMWRMLTSRAQDLQLTLADHTDTTAHWLADYTFTQTGRTVHNDVRATFRFRDGLICDHRDAFSFWAWSRQALGLPGLALGWTPLLQAKVRAQARKGLAEFRAGRG